jgi:hypothetical protein
VTHHSPGHFMQVCEYGFVHGQCRCPGPKTEHAVKCDNADHALLADYAPRHRKFRLEARQVDTGHVGQHVRGQ